MIALVEQRRKSIDFTKAKKTFSWSLYDKDDENSLNLKNRDL